MDILLMLLMFAGVHFAYITHRAGLPRFAITMAVMTLIGYPLLLAGGSDCARRRPPLAAAHP